MFNNTNNYLSGHELEQIRQRALSNLIAKLDNGLISLEELANEKYLHVILLEWFNFPSWPLSKEVLMLIKRLIQVIKVLLQ